MQYWIYLDRRTQINDKHDELEHQCFNLFPDRWNDLYRNNPDIPAGDIGTAFDGEPELVITDPSELDAWFNGLSGRQGMSGADVLGHAEGAGRLV